MKCGGVTVCVCVVRMLLSARLTQASELQLNTQRYDTHFLLFFVVVFLKTHTQLRFALEKFYQRVCVCVCGAVFQPFDVNLASLWLQRDLWSCSRCLLLALPLFLRVCVTSLPAADVIVSFPDHACCCGSVTFPPWLVFFAYKATQDCCLFRWWCVGGNFACHVFWGRRLQLESAGKERKWVLANIKLAVCSISQQSQRQHHSFFRFVVSTLFTAEWQEKTPTAGRALCAHRWTIKGAISGYRFILLYLHTLSFHFKEPVKKL